MSNLLQHQGDELAAGFVDEGRGEALVAVPLALQFLKPVAGKTPLSKLLGCVTPTQENAGDAR